MRTLPSLISTKEAAALFHMLPRMFRRKYVETGILTALSFRVGSIRKFKYARSAVEELFARDGVYVRAPHYDKRIKTRQERYQRMRLRKEVSEC